MSAWQASLLVAAGAAVGGLGRYWTQVAVDRLGQQLPWGTLAVNILGSLLIGYIIAGQPKESVKLFAMVGVLGGFTTFSSYSLQTWQLFESGRHLAALVYALGSMIVGVLAVWLGIILRTKLLA